MGKGKYALSLVVLAAILLSGSALALVPDYVVSNSEDWRDVYSSILYADLLKADSGFLTSTKAGTLLLNTIDADNKNIQIMSSSKVPYIVGYKDIVTSRNFNAEEFSFLNVNLELAKKLPEITKFIIVDDAYGYNAISVAPYAALDSWYVLLINTRTLSQLDSFLASRKVDRMIIYGNVERAVLLRFAKYNPEIINKDGDRFENNIEMVKKYLAISGSKQVILTNGEFIEKEVMSGAEPVIFIGSNNVPTAVQDYIKGTDISTAVLIGNELVGTATFIRRQLGLSVFVKFAQGARNPEGAISQVEGLDLFYLPRYNLNIDIFKISYNQATRQLEVTYTNKEAQAAYLKGTITITDSSGNSVTVGDTDAVFIDGNAKKTIVYRLEEILQGNITARIYTIYGESKKSLEKVLERTIPISTIEVMDNSAINITGLEYDERKGVFLVEIKNTGSVTAYVDIELPDVIVNGIPTTLALKDIASLAPGETRKLEVPVPGKLTEGDITDNSEITVRAYYGERAESLVKYATAVFPMKKAGFDYVYYATTYGLTAAIILVLILIIVAFIRRRKKKREGFYNY
jgi:archaellum component FlaF (FlaF/FlaG flagellin family)